MREELVQMFAATNLLTYPEQEFVLAKLHPHSYRDLMRVLAREDSPDYQTVVRAHDEVTLVATTELWQRISGELEVVSLDMPWRLITMDITIPLDVFGYMEQVAKICAACEASMVVEAGYSTDHVLVSAERYRDVLESLNEFIHRCRESVTIA